MPSFKSLIGKKKKSDGLLPFFFLDIPPLILFSITVQYCEDIVPISISSTVTCLPQIPSYAFRPIICFNLKWALKPILMLLQTQCYVNSHASRLKVLGQIKCTFLTLLRKVWSYLKVDVSVRDVTCEMCIFKFTTQWCLMLEKKEEYFRSSPHIIQNKRY